MKYTITHTKLFNDDVELLHGHTEDGLIWSIPFAEDNAMYQQYLAWVAEGNEAEEWKPETGE